MYGQPALKKYPSEVRKFCFALNYHSPAAYRIVREEFDKHLPHPKTLAAWMQNSDVNGEIGIRKETMERLARFVNDLKKSTGEPLICTLMFDEMYIRKQVFWDQSKFAYVGYPTYPIYENESEDISAPDQRNERTTKATKAKKGKNKPKSLLATRALVFMLSGINKSFEFPVGYHFVNGLGRPC